MLGSIDLRLGPAAHGSMHAPASAVSVLTWHGKMVLGAASRQPWMAHCRPQQSRSASEEFLFLGN